MFLSDLLTHPYIEISLKSDKCTWPPTQMSTAENRHERKTAHKKDGRWRPTTCEKSVLTNTVRDKPVTDEPPHEKHPSQTNLTRADRVRNARYASTDLPLN